MIPSIGIALLADGSSGPEPPPPPLTHSEMTHLVPSECVGYSSCPGEMTRTPLHPGFAREIVRGRPEGTTSELWHCRLCGWTAHIERDRRGVRRIRNAYPAPSLPSPRAIEPD